MFRQSLGKPRSQQGERRTTLSYQKIEASSTPGSETARGRAESAGAGAFGEASIEK